jgi:hypothetical protein
MFEHQIIYFDHEDIQFKAYEIHLKNSFNNI